MPELLEEYQNEEDFNRKYRLLLRERKKLREEFHEKHDTEEKREEGNKEEDYIEAYEYDTEEFREFLREKDEEVDGNLLVFPANDFGAPLGFRPEGKRKELFNDVRKEILSGKYTENEKLNWIREEVLEFDDRIHKVLVAVHRGDEIEYHVPEGREEETNFLTVREYIGLIDWVANSQTNEQEYAKEY